MTNYSIAKSYHDAELNIIPLKNKKTPKIKYAQYHDYPYPWYLCQKWFFSRGCPSGIAIICGKTSGNLEVLDFDFNCNTIFPQWYQRILDNPTTNQISTTLPIVRTPRDGVHIFYRCPEIGSNQKLAMIDGNVAIETRGRGGYVCTVGTPTHMHPLNRPYRLVRGSLGSIPTIRPNERQILLRAARGFHDPVANSRTCGSQAGLAWIQPSLGALGITQPSLGTTQPSLGSTQPSLGSTQPSPKARRQPNQDRLGDRFNRRASWQEILCPHGWTVNHIQGDVTYWARPEKIDGGWSATTNYGGSDRLIVHSTSTPFEATSRENKRSYDKFAAMAVLRYDGDYSLAARSLAK